MNFIHPQGWKFGTIFRSVTKGLWISLWN